MKIIITIIAIVFLCLFNSIHSQYQLVINGTFLRMNGGTSAIPLFLVIENPNENAIINETPCGTPCTATGGILSENEFNIVEWKQDSISRNYTLPFVALGLEYIPFTFSMVQPAIPSNTCFYYSTEPVSAANLPLPSDVTSMDLSTVNNLSVVDRFWHIGDNGATTRPEGSIKFTYLSTELAIPNTVNESELITKRFNTLSNTWNDYSGNSVGLNLTDKTTTTELIFSQDFYRTWTLCNALIIENVIPLSCGELFIPTGFSPNADGKNDVFKVRYNTECITEFQFQIFDRWGEIIYNSTNKDESWDGSFKGKMMNDDAFVYKLKVKTLNDTESNYLKGYIIMKK